MSDVIFVGLRVKFKGYVWFWDVLSNLLTSLVPLYLAIGKSHLQVRTFCIVIVLVVLASCFSFIQVVLFAIF